MKSREELIKVWEDTNEVINSMSNTDLSSYYGKSINFKPIDDSSKCNIVVDNRDCIEVANDLSKLGKTCMLNMASYKHPGGGVKRGAMAQEEELARRSNLMLGLDESKYPFKKDFFIYTKNVTFIKDKNYTLIDPFKCDIITIPALNLNGLEKDRNYEEMTSYKIKTMLHEPYINGCENLVLSAFGCGVFKNDPHMISKMFKDIIDEGFGKMYKNIYFAILNDRNSVSNNYSIFYNTML